MSYPRDDQRSFPTSDPPPTRKASPFQLLALAGLAYLGYKEWKSSRHSARTRYGYDTEDAIAAYLERRGAEVWLSNGSRGAIDVYADWGRGMRWGIQVKSSRDGVPKLPGPAERADLLAACRDWRARAVIALRGNGRTFYYDVKSGRRLVARSTRA